MDRKCYSSYLQSMRIKCRTNMKNVYAFLDAKRKTNEDTSTNPVKVPDGVPKFFKQTNAGILFTLSRYVYHVQSRV